MANRLYEKYKKEIAPAVAKEYKLENIMQVPRILKVSINSGVGAFRDNKEAFENFITELSEISGQKIYIRKAKKSEAGFKMKQGDIVGIAVTLRSDKMWAFLDKFVTIVLPRVRDFRGVNPDAFDENGNYSIGIKEHTIFPEINPNVVKGIRSLQLTIVMSSGNTDLNRSLLTRLGFPFRKDNK
jgi:large subunit ribosomal protein L5